MPRFFGLLTAGCLLTASVGSVVADFTYDSNPANLMLIAGTTQPGVLTAGGLNPSTSPADTQTFIFLLSFALTSNNSSPPVGTESWSLTDNISITSTSPSGVVATGTLSLNVILNLDQFFPLGSPGSFMINGVPSINNTDPASATVVVGDIAYTLSNFHYNSPGLASPGYLAADVSTSGVPEPGSLTLLAISSAIGVVGWTRRRGRAAF